MRNLLFQKNLFQEVLPEKLVKPALKRQAAYFFEERWGLSQRRWQLMDMQGCSFRYQAQREDDTLVRERLKQLSRDYPPQRSAWVATGPSVLERAFEAR